MEGGSPGRKPGAKTEASVCVLSLPLDCQLWGSRGMSRIVPGWTTTHHDHGKPMERSSCMNGSGVSHSIVFG